MNCFAELKSLAAKLDNELPNILSAVSQPRRPGLSGDAAMVKIEKIHEEILGTTASAKNTMRDVKRMNTSVKNFVEFGGDRLTSIDEEINSLVEKLKDYGYTPENSEKKVTSLQTPEENLTPQVDENQHTPDLTNFGLSSNAVELIYSTQKSTINQTRIKNIQQKTDEVAIPKFDLDNTVLQEDFDGGSNLNGLKMSVDLRNGDHRMDFQIMGQNNEFKSAKDVKLDLVNGHNSNAIGDSTPETPELTSIIPVPPKTESGDYFESPLTPTPTFLSESNLDVTPTTPEFTYRFA